MNIITYHAHQNAELRQHILLHQQTHRQITGIINACQIYLIIWLLPVHLRNISLKELDDLRLNNKVTKSLRELFHA